MNIAHIFAQEILDSRGNPTVETELTLDSGQVARASVPSGASTGTHEALELRDEDPERYNGKGVLQAVKNVNHLIAPALQGKSVLDQNSIDNIMLDLDGTENKENLGANAILSVSIAAAKAAAILQKIPTYTHIAHLFGYQTDEVILPMPMMNLLNGGQHAVNSTDFQEYMIIPIGAPTISEAIRWGAETFHALGKIIRQKGWVSTVGDEGGYAPPLSSNEEPLELITQAIELAGYNPGTDIVLAMDVAASEFYSDNLYQLNIDHKQLSADQLIDQYRSWIKLYPIFSIEDGLAEDDWENFGKLTSQLGEKIQIVGDDLFVTNPKRLERGIREHTANSILIKLNQIGTISETIEAVIMAQQAKMSAVISHRSGETEDSFLADFAIGARTGQIKTGSLSRSERIAKYNQLMRIEQSLGSRAKLAKFPFA